MMLKITKKKKGVAYLMDNAPVKVKKKKILFPIKEVIQLPRRGEMS